MTAIKEAEKKNTGKRLIRSKTLDVLEFGMLP